MKRRGCFQRVPCLNTASIFKLNTDQTESYISSYNVREMIEMVAYSQESNILTDHCVIIVTHASGCLQDLQEVRKIKTQKALLKL